MHHRPGVSSQRSVVDVADCRISAASQDIVGTMPYLPKY